MPSLVLGGQASREDGAMTAQTTASGNMAACNHNSSCVCRLLALQERQNHAMGIPTDACADLSSTFSLGSTNSLLCGYEQPFSPVWSTFHNHPNLGESRIFIYLPPLRSAMVPTESNQSESLVRGTSVTRNGKIGGNVFVGETVNNISNGRGRSVSSSRARGSASANHSRSKSRGSAAANNSQGRGVSVNGEIKLPPLAAKAPEDGRERSTQFFSTKMRISEKRDCEADWIFNQTKEGDEIGHALLPGFLRAIDRSMTFIIASAGALSSSLWPKPATVSSKDKSEGQLTEKKGPVISTTTFDGVAASASERIATSGRKMGGTMKLPSPVDGRAFSRSRGEVDRFQTTGDTIDRRTKRIPESRLVKELLELVQKDEDKKRRKPANDVPLGTAI